MNGSLHTLQHKDHLSCTHLQRQPRQCDRQQATLNGIQNDHTLQQQRTPYLCTSNMEQAHCHGCCPKSFSVIHHQREPVFLWRNGNEFKTNHHHHQSVACDLLVGGTQSWPGLHCTQVNCSQNRYDIKDVICMWMMPDPESMGPHGLPSG